MTVWCSILWLVLLETKIKFLNLLCAYKEILTFIRKVLNALRYVHVPRITRFYRLFVLMPSLVVAAFGYKTSNTKILTNINNFPNIRHFHFGPSLLFLMNNLNVRTDSNATNKKRRTQNAHYAHCSIKNLLSWHSLLTISKRSARLLLCFCLFSAVFNVSYLEIREKFMFIAVFCFK